MALLAEIRTGNRADAKTRRRLATERRVIAAGRQEEVTGVLRQALATPLAGARAGVAEIALATNGFRTIPAQPTEARSADRARAEAGREPVNLAVRPAWAVRAAVAVGVVAAGGGGKP